MSPLGTKSRICIKLGKEIVGIKTVGAFFQFHFKVSIVEGLWREGGWNAWEVDRLLLLAYRSVKGWTEGRTDGRTDGEQYMSGLETE